MVPKDLHEIPKVIDDALARLTTRVSADRASVARDPDAVRGSQGVAALDAVLKAADALKNRLAERTQAPAPSAAPMSQRSAE